MRDAGCGMRDAGCGMRDAGFGYQGWLSWSRRYSGFQPRKIRSSRPGSCRSAARTIRNCVPSRLTSYAGRQAAPVSNRPLNNGCAACTAIDGWVRTLATSICVPERKYSSVPSFRQTGSDPPADETRVTRLGSVKRSDVHLRLARLVGDICEYAPIGREGRRPLVCRRGEHLTH